MITRDDAATLADAAGMSVNSAMGFIHGTVTVNEIQKCLQLAYAKGLEDMRERAAKVCDGYTALDLEYDTADFRNAAGAIRALTLQEQEQK